MAARAAGHAGDNRACGTALVRLTVDNLAIARPDPVLHALRSLRYQERFGK